MDTESVELHEELRREMLVVELTYEDVMHLISLLGDSSADERLADVLMQAMREQKNVGAR